MVAGTPSAAPGTVGILALQGDVREHAAAFAELGVATRSVRRPAELEGLAGIVLPGGESTTLSMLLVSSGLFEPLASALAGGLPVLGTCAGLVLLATEVLDGRPDQRSFGVLDCVVRRNGYGRQAESFESALDASKLAAELGTGDEPMPAVFIRAPVVTEVGADVEVLAQLVADGGRVDPVVLRQGNVVAASFHPELTGDRRVHALFGALLARAGERAPELEPGVRSGSDSIGRAGPRGPGTGQRGIDDVGALEVGHHEVPQGRSGQGAGQGLRQADPPGGGGRP